MSDYKDPFGVSFDLPSFPHPDSFKRNVVPGPIPAPTLLTEAVALVDLDYGDIVLYLNILTVTYRSDDGMWVELRGYSNPDSTYLRTERSDMLVNRVRGVTFGLLSQEIPLEWLRDDSRTYFGKFANQLEEYCWTVALEQDYDRVGHCDEMGFVATRVDITLVDGHNYPLRSDSVIRQWADLSGDYPAGYIVTENDRGMVSVEFFDTVAELETEWQRLQDLETELRGPDEDDVVIQNGMVLFAGKLIANIGNYHSEEDIYPIIRAEMETQKFYPNVWRISDHGNATIIDIGQLDWLREHVQSHGEES